MCASTCSPPFRTFDFGVFKSFWCVHPQSCLWYTGNKYRFRIKSININMLRLMFDSFSAHKVKGNEGGKGGKKEKQKEDSSPVRNLEVPEL